MTDKQKLKRAFELADEYAAWRWQRGFTFRDTMTYDDQQRRTYWAFREAVEQGRIPKIEG